MAGRTGAGGRPTGDDTDRTTSATDDGAAGGDVDTSDYGEVAPARWRIWSRWGRSAALSDDGDDDDAEDAGHDDDAGDAAGAGETRIGDRNAPSSSKSDDAAADDLTLKPSAMRGSEPMYGYLVALELIVVSVLNMTVTHGKGAPTGPQHVLGASFTATELRAVGLVAALALLGVIQTRNRLIVPFAAIVAAFFATLPKVPNSLAPTHLVALIIPVVYAFVLTQRQRKSTLAQARAGGPTRSRTTPEQRRREAGNRRARRQGAVQTGPQANRRYTPPKAKRPRR